MNNGTNLQTKMETASTSIDLILCSPEQIPLKEPVRTRYYVNHCLIGDNAFTAKGQAWLYSDGTSGFSLDSIFLNGVNVTDSPLVSMKDRQTINLTSFTIANRMLFKDAVYTEVINKIRTLTQDGIAFYFDTPCLFKWDYPVWGVAVGAFSDEILVMGNDEQWHTLEDEPEQQRYLNLLANKLTAY